MFVRITNTPRDYSWGTTDGIAKLLGTTAPGGPQAELWLGTHPGSPSRLIDGPDGATTLGQLTELPFIMKVLSAGMSLSLQAHPSSEQAIEGFARENREGIPLDAPNRNYKDALHKPELIYALSDEFEALCGFRSVAATRELLATLGPDPASPDPLVQGFIDRLQDDASLKSVFEWLISGGDRVAELRERVLELAPASGAPEFATALRLSEQFPADVGILLSVLLNLVTLRAGEAIYLPSGNIHAYQHGLGIEVLAASDNVLRGGLTPKYVDVPELLKVVDFRPLPVPYLRPEHPVAGLTLFRPDVPDFELAVIRPTDAGSADATSAPTAAVEFAPAAEFVALCVEAPLTIHGSTGSIDLARGDSIFATEDESPLVVTGTGTLFVATANPQANATD